MKHYLRSLLLLIAAAAAPVIAAQTTEDTPPAEQLIAPSQADFAIGDLQLQWIMNRYAVVDSLGRRETNNDLSEEAIITRLQRLPTEIEMPYNDQVAGVIRFYVEKHPDRVQRILARSIYFMPIFEDALARYGLPLELKNLAIAESALVTQAKSKVGAQGLWQFMPSTAKDEGLEVNSLIDQRLDPYASSDAAARYLKKLYNIFNDWGLAIAAYNCGPGRVSRVVNASKGAKDYWSVYYNLPKETQGYVPSFIAANYIMDYFGDHGIKPVLTRKPIALDTVHVSRYVHLEQISKVLDIPMDDLRAMNPQFIKDVIPGDYHPYVLVLPSVQAACYVANEDSIVNFEAEKYARVDRIDPGRQTPQVGSDGTQYVEELVKITYTVKKKDTFNSIAKKFGVSASDIRKWNGLKKNARLRAGMKLTIHTYKRRPLTQAEIDANSTTASSDSTAVVATTVPVDTVNVAPEVAPTTPTNTTIATTTTPITPTQKPTPQYTTYVVKAGDNLSKVASRHGVTVNQIKEANSLKSDNIMVGQKLKIPTKATTPANTGKKKKSRKSKK